LAGALALTQDPGSPWRFTLSAGFTLSRQWGLGVSAHRFTDIGPLDGLRSYDVGLTGRIGNYLALGAVIRDLNSPTVGVQIAERRYEGELIVRPLGNPRLLLAAGARIAERSERVDAWGRVETSFFSGVSVVAQIESRRITGVETQGAGSRDIAERQWRATLGLDISLGAVGSTVLTSAERSAAGNNALTAGTLLLRSSAVATPSVVPDSQRIEKLELTGALTGETFARLLERMVDIEQDPNVKAVVISFDAPSGGWGSLQEVRDRMMAMRQAGKKVFAYLVTGDTRDYFVASAADKIYMDPVGALRLLGVAGSSMYYRGAFDMVGVSAQFEKIAEFKSAPEQYTNRQGSASAVAMRNELLGGINQQFIAAVAQGRKLSQADVKALIDAGPYTAGDLAVDHKLIDAVALPEKISELITNELGGGYPVGPSAVTRDDHWQHPAIAVIHIEGDIVDGKSQAIPFLGQSMAGGDSLRQAIVAARNDSRVAAIVLRIDSPGGSALASELIAREVFATRGVKPIICSMGDVAASGGYYVAAGCDRIFAQPTTITGSIGIFFGKFDFSGLLAKVGVAVETSTFSKRADMDSYFRPFTQEERTVLLEKLRYMYGRFVGAVSEGRKLSKERVDELGRGHVWTGAQAKERGLVDEFGGLTVAVAYAKKQAGLGAKQHVQWLHSPRDAGNFVQSLLGLSTNSTDLTEGGALQQLLGMLPLYALVAPNQAQARLPFDISWQ
jgi:protease IV